MDRARNALRLSWHLVAVTSFVLTLVLAAGASPALGQAASGRIVGTVFGSNTSPVAGARIEAFSMMENGGVIDSFLVEAVTDERGRYELVFRRPGCYVVKASARGYVPQIYGRTGPWDQPCVQVNAGEIVQGIDFHLQAAGAILGRVVDSRSGAPIARARVMAWPAWNDTVAPIDPTDPPDPGPDGRGDGWAITDENGDYRMDGLAEGAYVVFAEAESYLPEFFDNAPYPERATPVGVRAGQETAHIDFALGRGGCITGIVTSEADGQPVAGAQVWAFPDIPVDPAGGSPGTRRDGHPGNGVTGADGRYTLCGLPPGEVFVQVWADGFLGEFYDDAARFEDADPVSVPADGEVAGIDFALSRGGSIEGRIHDGSGAPVPGAWVTAWAAWFDTTIVPGDPNTDPRGWGGTVQADSSGRYVLSGLDSGSYIVLADAPPFLTTYYPGTQDPSQATPVVVTAPDATTGIDIEMTRGGSIAGVVRDQITNEPVARAWVELFLPYMGGYEDTTGTSPFPGPGAVTDESGNYRIDGVPSGSYTVFCTAWEQDYEPEFYKDARVPENATPVVVKAPDATGGIDFTLTRQGPPRGEIAGVITREGDASPLPGAVVFAISLDGQAGIATSGADGGYAIRGLPDGSYYVFAAATGMIGEFYDDALGWEEASPVALSGFVSGVNFALGEQSIGPGVIEGRVVDAAGRGISQVWVYAEPAASGARGFTTTAADGRYALAGLAPGSYYVRATRVGFESRYYGGGPELPDAQLVQVPAGAVRGVNIVLSGGGSGHPGADAALRVLGNMPNPFRGSTTIRFSGPAAGAPVTVQIYDIRGRLVRRLNATTSSEEAQSIVWNGRDGAGRRAPAGVYVYRVNAGGRGASGRMLLVE